MQSDPDASPFNSLPPAVVALAFALFAVELVLSAGARGYFGGQGAVGWRLDAIGDYAFFSQVLDYMMETGRYTLPDIARFLTYPFVHGGFTHMLFVVVFLLALGKMVGETVGSFAVLAVFFGSAVFGALAYAALTKVETPLIGGFPAVYGLIGAFTFLLWVRLGAVGAPQINAFSLIGVLLAIQLVFGLLFGGGKDWVAEVAGFCFGFAVTPLVAPGGFQRLLAKMRER
ncbi:MAG: rhomboid family intramembrane serine protease [Pseudomonadota bacterium]